MSGTAQLFHSRDPLTLAGARCPGCGTVTFPVQDGCPRCAGGSTEVVALPRAGALWTWTVQTFPPRAPFVVPPSGFEPFCLGYVDLGDVVVETRIDAEPEELTVGCRMTLVGAVWQAEDGLEVDGYAFTPEAAA